jgi:hypothetical protein
MLNKFINTQKVSSVAFTTTQLLSQHGKSIRAQRQLKPQSTSMPTAPSRLATTNIPHRAPDSYTQKAEFYRSTVFQGL